MAGQQPAGRKTNRRVIGAQFFAAGLMLGIGWLTWFRLTPGEITANEFHVALLAGSPCLVVALCAAWVGDGRPPVDTRRK